jgi:proline iminopeptidase
MSERRTLYPEIEPYDTGRLQVSPVHDLYYEQCGNAAGKPVVFLHGGPGAGLVPDYRRFFDPAAYRVVLFDQRGSGKSTPHASLEDNTTWHLVADIELIREHLGIEQWLVFGGSWGSTLALAYAETHPERVTGLVLRGIYLGRESETRWFYEDSQGASAIFPDCWEGFIRLIPEPERISA